MLGAFSFTQVIIGITVVISIWAFSNEQVRYKLIFNPIYTFRDKQYYRILSHGLIHGDWMHLIFNMYVLYSFGTSLEYMFIGIKGEIGVLYWFGLYLGGIAFGVLPSYFKRRDDRSYFSLGASGGVMGMLVALAMIAPQVKYRIIFIPIGDGLPAWAFVPLLFLFEYYMDKRGGTRIAHDAHISGGFFGVIFMLLFFPQMVITAWSNLF